MISISTLLFDIDGDFTFSNEEVSEGDRTDRNVSRRISKVKTLDGGVYIDDNGYSAGDTDINIIVKNPTEMLYSKLKSLFLYHSFVKIISSSGNFLCVPSSIKIQNNDAVMIFSTKQSI